MGLKKKRSASKVVSKGGSGFQNERCNLTPEKLW